jgi:hypothetical protein
MPTPRDFPPLQVCEPCKRLFTDYKGPADDESIQYQMWYTSRGYKYKRMRRDLERSAQLECAFCKAVALRDAKYGQGSQPVEVCFDGPRPEWYPSLDEELEFRIRYNWVDNELYIWSVRGVNWTGGDLSWGLYTTAGKFVWYGLPRL